jgi:hypothetical protein
MSARNVVILCTLIAGGMVALPSISHAQVRLSVNIGVPPPPPRVEVVPPPRSGYIWAPGYWRWEGRRHVWMDGHWQMERPGHYWVAERWVQEGRHWRMEPGHWERGHEREWAHERDRR